MQIGAIGAMSYTPYIYNTNSVSRASLNKIAGIGDDLLEKKTDFSELTSQETTNPLKRGESLDFTGILGMQMQMGRMNAARIMKEPEKSDEITQAAGITSAEEELTATQPGVASDALTSVVDSTAESAGASSFDFAKALAAYQPFEMYA